MDTYSSRVRSSPSTTEIAANMAKFNRESCARLNVVHFEGIDQLLTIENESAQLPNDVSSRLVRAATVRFWTQVANQLAWMAFGGERAYLKQYWSGRDRNPLRNCSPAFVLSALKKEMDNGNLAVWTDATSFLELGDILSFNPTTRKRTFLEVKGLNESEAITVSPYVEPDALAALRRTLQESDGQSKADKKVDRLNRQLKRNREVDRLVADEIGFNPLRQLHVLIQDGPYRDEHYERALEPEFRLARQRGHSLVMVDDCLWIGIYYNLDPRFERIFAGSAAAAFGDISEVVSDEYMETVFAERINYLQASNQPLALPSFFISLPDDIVSDMIAGRAMVRFSFDWKRFAMILKEFDCTLNWEKPSGEDLAGDGALVLRRGVPSVVGPCGNSVKIGAPLFMRVFSDFIRPRAFALQVVGFLEAAEGMRKDVHETDGPGPEQASG